MSFLLREVIFEVILTTFKQFNSSDLTDEIDLLKDIIDWWRRVSPRVALRARFERLTNERR